MEKGEWRSGDICWDSPRMTVISNDVEAHAERKKRRRFTGASCQVPFCGNSLELQYHKKYHVCREHFAAPCVALEGVNSRFCQKCGKFQAVDAFDAEKRTCRVALAQHNARRRKCDKAAVGSPPGSAAAGGSSSGGAAGSAGNATATAAAGASSRAAGSACAASNGAVRPRGGAAADGRIGTGAAVLLATPEGHGSQQGAASAALDGSPPLKRQQVGQRQRQQAESPQLPGACNQALPPGSARAQQQQAHLQVQTALPPEQPLAGQDEEMPAALLTLRKPAGHRQREAPIASGAQADTAAPPALLPTGPSARLCAAALDVSGSAGSNGAALPVCWPAQQGLSDGRPLPDALPGALLHAPDLIMLTSGSSGSMGPVPSGVLALQPGSHLMGARQPCSPPARTGWAAASHEDRLLSVSPLGGLPDSCFAEPSGLPFSHPPYITGQQQQQQQWQAQAGGLAEQPSGSAAALGGFAAFSTNLPVSLQVEARPAPTVQQPPVRLAQHPMAAEHQLLGQLEGPAQHRPLPAAPGHNAALSYAPPTSLHRISLKIFQCTPEQLAPGIREELEAMMGVAPAMLESYIRPGCTRLTVDMRLPRGQAAAAAATRDAASLLHALRVPRALGSAATNAMVLQCALGGLARAPAGGGAAEAVPAAPPCLAVRPACIALPPDGQPWQLLGLQLLPAQEAGWDLGQTTVLARQSGRHLAVSMWGTDLPAAQAASYAACGHAEQVAPRALSAHSPRDSGSGSSSGGAQRWPSRSPSAFSGEDGTDSAFEEPCDGGVQPACLPGSRAGGCLWVRLSGLRPGCCELEAERLSVAALPAGAAGAAHRAVPLLSHPAPLLVLRDAAEADEVQRLVGAGGLAGREGADSLLRDIGLAAAYLEGTHAGDAAQAGHLLPPPALVAATSAAALAFVQQQGMPAVERLLRRALAAATAGAATAGGSITAAPSAALPAAEPAELASARAAAASPATAGNGLGEPAEGAGAASCADAAPLRHPPSKADGKLGVAKEASWEADPCGVAQPTGKAAATGGSGRQGPSCTAIRVQALMQDVEGLAAGGEPADTARQPGCLGSLSARGQGLSWHGLLRLGVGLAAFFVAVLIVRILPVAG